MKNLILFTLLVTVALFSCSLENREPEFKRVENVKIKSATAKKTVITADVIVYNPNGVSVFLNQTDIDVFANDIKITHITQTNKTEITKKSEFKIPLKAKFKLMDLLKDQNSVMSLLKNSLGALKEKKINLKFDGTAEFEVAGIKFEVPIEYEELVEIK